MYKETRTKGSKMKFILVFFAGIGIGVIAGVIGQVFPDWNNLAWWLGGSFVSTMAYEMIRKEEK